MMRLVMFCFLLLLYALPQFANAEIEFELDRPPINISTGFSGDTIGIYGVKKPAHDVVIIIRAPDRIMKVRRKEKVFGGWMNRSYLLFEKVPGFYRIGASGDLDSLISEEDRKLHQVGVDNIFMPSPSASASDYNIFKDALLRNKLDEQLILQDVEPIEIIKDRFFKASFYVPHNMPVGRYTVDVYAFKDKVLMDKTSQSFEVKQVGMNSVLHDFAGSRPLLYGLLCVFLAIFAGWLSNRLKRLL